MTHRFADITFTDSVKAAQEQCRSRSHNERLQANGGPNCELGPEEADFIGQRDSFYVASVSETGWPYVQHRGGPPGFLKVIGPGQIAYANFRGNAQMISVGNVAQDGRCSLILMDYPNRRRLKILGHMRVERIANVDADVVKQVELPGYRALIERVVFFDIEAFDWNCPQHITRRYTEPEMQEMLVEQTL